MIDLNDKNNQLKIMISIAVLSFVFGIFSLADTVCFIYLTVVIFTTILVYEYPISKNLFLSLCLTIVTISISPLGLYNLNIGSIHFIYLNGAILLVLLDIVVVLLGISRHMGIIPIKSEEKEEVIGKNKT